MSFGFEWRRRLNGAGAYVLILQVCSLLPGLYIFLAAGYMAIMAGTNLFSVLFDLGLAALPRWEAAALSALYRASGSEVAVFFALTGSALLFGLISKRLLQGSRRSARMTRWGLIGLIAGDLILRLIPLSLHQMFPLWASLVSFALRGLCLWMLVMDLRAEKKTSAREE